MQRIRTYRTAGWLTTAGLVGVALVAPQAALARQNAESVTICHRTDSDSNPYRQETVDVSSTGTLQGGHSDHTGPIWDATLKDLHIKWGDIIPPYTYGNTDFAGYNWAAGKAIYDGGCVIPGSTPAATATATATAAATATATATVTPDAVVTATATATITPNAAATATATVTPEGPATATATATVTPEGAATATATATIAPYTTVTATATPDATGTGGGNLATVTNASPSANGGPAGQVAGVTDTRNATPPPTDTVPGPTSTPSGGSWRLILLAMAGLLASLLVLTPAADRTRR